MSQSISTAATYPSFTVSGPFNGREIEARWPKGQLIDAPDDLLVAVTRLLASYCHRLAMDELRDCPAPFDVAHDLIRFEDRAIAEGLLVCLLGGNQAKVNPMCSTRNMRSLFEAEVAALELD